VAPGTNTVGSTRPVPTRRCHEHRAAVGGVLRRRNLGRTAHGARRMGGCGPRTVPAGPQGVRADRL